MEPARQPLSVQVMLRDDSHAESWRRLLEHVKTSTATYWLVTCGAHGTPAGPRARDLRRRPRPGVRARWHADRASVLLRGLGVRAPGSAARTRAGTSSRKSRTRDLLRLCGGIYIGDPESPVFTGSLASARDVTVLSIENNGARRENGSSVARWELLDAAEVGCPTG